jgi:hypothetical protein
MEFIKITDRVVYFGQQIKNWNDDRIRLIVTDTHEKFYAVSDGRETHWVDKSHIRRYKISDSHTNSAFVERINAEKKSHEKLYHLSLINNGEIAMAYGSLAANSLTTLHIIKSLYAIFKEEFIQM